LLIAGRFISDGALYSIFFVGVRSPLTSLRIPVLLLLVPFVFAWVTDVLEAAMARKEAHLEHRDIEAVCRGHTRHLLTVEEKEAFIQSCVADHRQRIASAHSATGQLHFLTWLAIWLGLALIALKISLRDLSWKPTPWHWYLLLTLPWWYFFLLILLYARIMPGSVSSFDSAWLNLLFFIKPLPLLYLLGNSNTKTQRPILHALAIGLLLLGLLGNLFYWIGLSFSSGPVFG